MIIRNLEKFLRAVDLLSSGNGVTIKELMQQLNLSRSSVYRLIWTIESMGFPLYDEKAAEESLFDARKRYRLIEDFVAKLPNINLPQIKLTLKEVILLNFLFSKAELFKGKDFQKTLSGLKKKLLRESFLTRETRYFLQKLDSILFDVTKFKKDYSEKEGIIDILIHSIVYQRRCLINYDSFTRGEHVKFLIEPLRLFEYSGGLYLFVNVPRYNNIRTIAVERIQSIEEQEKNFDYPKDFNADELLNLSFGIILDDPVSMEIWFDSSQAPYIKEKQWAQNQTLEEKSDGSIILRFRASGYFEIKKWVMSFGSSAKIIQPKRMANEIYKEAQDMKKLYDTLETGD